MPWLMPLLALLGQEPAASAACTWPARPDTSWTLPQILDEVSGLAVAPGDRLLAHDDERGAIVALNPQTGGILGRWRLRGEPADDFEGIAVVGTRVYLLTSRGRLYQFGLPASTGVLPYSVLETGLGKECEFEGLAADLGAGVLLFPCKVIREDRRGVALRIMRWDVARGGLGTPASIEVGLDAMRAATPWKRFGASAVEVDPRTGNLWVLSSTERGLIELAPDGTIRSARALDPRAHRQPEGLTILRDGTHLVSDEAAGGRARLSRYRCH